MVTVDHLLLAEHLELAGGEVVRPLQRPRCAERPTRPAGTLVLDGSDSAVFTPVEVCREAVGGEDRRFMRRPRPLEQVPSGGAGAAEAEELPPELGGGEVRELGDPVHRRGVEPLVAPRAEKVGLEHGQPVRALFVVAVGLAEPLDEAREVRLRVQLQLVVCAVTDHLLDERILSGGGVGRAERGSGEEESEEEEEASHGNWSC